MDKFTETGLFPLIGIGFKLIGRGIGNAVDFVLALLFGKRRGMKGEAPSSSLYIVTTVLSVIGTMALGYVSFSGSFSAASDFALKNGIAPNVSSYIPLAVDGLIVLCILAIFSASLGGYNAAWLSGVVMAFTGLSIYFNVSHMPADVSLINRYLLGGAFPVIVFLASESTSWQIKRMVAFMATVRTYGELVITVGELTSRKATTETEIEANQAQAQALNEKIKNYQTTVTNLERDLVILSTSAEVNEENLETVERRVKIIRIKAADPRTTQAQLAEILGTSQRTISRDISELTNGIASNIINGKKG